MRLILLVNISVVSAGSAELESAWMHFNGLRETVLNKEGSR
jgi:hypothetical protein